MGIRDKPIAPGSPWQNGFAERLIGSIRRECVDHVVVLGEAHRYRQCAGRPAAASTVRMHGQSIMRVFIDAMMRLAGLIRGIDVDDDERQII